MKLKTYFKKNKKVCINKSVYVRTLKYNHLIALKQIINKLLKLDGLYIIEISIYERDTIYFNILFNNYSNLDFNLASNKNLFPSHLVYGTPVLSNLMKVELKKKELKRFTVNYLKSGCDQIWENDIAGYKSYYMTGYNTGKYSLVSNA